MSEEGLDHLVVAQAPDAFIFADVQGKIRLWNPAAAEIFGHTPAEAIGQTLDLIVPEDLRNRHWAGFRRAIESGKTKYARDILTTRSMHKNGSKIYVSMTFSIVRDQTGQVIGSLALCREYTNQFEKEKALRKRVAELEHRLKA